MSVHKNFENWPAVNLFQMITEKNDALLEKCSKSAYPYRFMKETLINKQKQRAFISLE